MVRLAGEHLEITSAAVLVEHLGQSFGALRSSREHFLLLTKFAVFLGGNECVGNLFQRVLNGLLIGEHRLLVLGLGEPEPRTEPSAFEDRLCKGKSRVPGLGWRA